MRVLLPVVPPVVVSLDMLLELPELPVLPLELVLALGVVDDPVELLVPPAPMLLVPEVPEVPEVDVSAEVLPLVLGLAAVLPLLVLELGLVLLVLGLIELPLVLGLMEPPLVLGVLPVVEDPVPAPPLGPEDEDEDAPDPLDPEPDPPAEPPPDCAMATPPSATAAAAARVVSVFLVMLMV